MDINTTHEYAVAENIDGEWMLRKMRYESVRDAERGLSDLGAVDDPSYAIVLVTTIVAPVPAS